MAGIDTELNIIEGGIYGRDVRQAIHDGLEKTYNDASVNPIRSSGHASLDASNYQSYGLYDVDNFPLNQCIVIRNNITESMITNLPVYGYAMNILTYTHVPDSTTGWGAVQLAIVWEKGMFYRYKRQVGGGDTSTVWNEWQALSNDDGSFIKSSNHPQVSPDNYTTVEFRSLDDMPVNSIWAFRSDLTREQFSQLPEYGVTMTVMSYGYRTDVSDGAIQIVLTYSSHVYYRIHDNNGWRPWGEVADWLDVNEVRKEVYELKDNIGYLKQIPTDWITGSAISSINGSQLSLSQYASTDYIRIQGRIYNSISVWSSISNSVIGIAFYDSNKNFIVGYELIGSSVLRENVVSVPTEACYFRFTCSMTNYENASWAITSSLEQIINNHAKGERYVTPQMFGAKGDGVTDDYNAFVTAFKFSADNNYAVYIPRTNNGYLIDASGFVTDDTSVAKGIPIYNKQTILSDNAIIKIKEGSLTSDIAIFYSYQYKSASYDQSAETLYDIIVSGITIQGASTDLNGDYSMTAFAFTKCENVTIKNVHIKNMSGIKGSGYGIMFAFSKQINMLSCSIDRTDRSNVYVWETVKFFARNCKFKDSYYRDNITISSFDRMQYQESSVDIRFCDFINITGTGTHCIRFSGNSGGIIESCNITGTIETESSDTLGLDGIYIVVNADRDVILRNNIINDCTYGIRTDVTSNKNILIENNKILNCVNGIRSLSENSTIFVKGNIIKNSKDVPLYIINALYATVDGNIFDGIPSSLTLFPKINLFLSNNFFRNYTAIMPNGYLVVISVSEWATITFNRSYYKGGKMRVLSKGIALGNYCGFDSDTLEVNEFNVQNPA